MGWNVGTYIAFLRPQWHRNSDKGLLSELELGFLLKVTFPSLLVFPGLLFPKDGSSLPGLMGEMHHHCRDYRAMTRSCRRSHIYRRSLTPALFGQDGHLRRTALSPTSRDGILSLEGYLASFFLSFSSSSSFWAEVRLSASARLSTAMAKNTFSRISVCVHS